ncbi:hypothetical protein LTS18_012344, partial [Coniosporium uncinatum]
LRFSLEKPREQQLQRTSQAFLQACKVALREEPCAKILRADFSLRCSHLEASPDAATPTAHEFVTEILYALDQLKFKHAGGGASDDNTTADLDGPAVYACENGLINACVQAYTYQHRLILRPEDFWLAILVQLSFFISVHAGELRDLFVKHGWEK